MTLFITIHALICLFLVTVILIQPGKGDAGIGFGSGSSQSIFGSKGASNFLTKTTTVCAVLYLMTSFVLTRTRMQEYNKSVIKGSAEPSAPVTIPVPAGAKADKAAPTKSEAPKKAGN